MLLPTVHTVMHKPIFCVVKSAGTWSVDAEWPDGTIERIKTFKAELEARDWLIWQSSTWLQWRHTDFDAAAL
jgi:hypothetical protein